MSASAKRFTVWQQFTNYPFGIKTFSKNLHAVMKLNGLLVLLGGVVAVPSVLFDML